MSSDSRAKRRIRNHIANLGSDDRQTAIRAERYLIRHYGARALEYLIEACSHPSPHVRFRAVWALGQTRDPRAFETILRLTSDPDEGVRYDATLALGELGDDRAIQPLVEMVLESDETKPADGALGDFGLKAVEHACRLLVSNDFKVRRCAVNLVGRLAKEIGSQQCVESLKKALTDSDENVREEADFWLQNYQS